MSYTETAKLSDLTRGQDGRKRHYHGKAEGFNLHYTFFRRITHGEKHTEKWQQKQIILFSLILCYSTGNLWLIFTRTLSR
jgi:hypothetical protein